MERLFIELEFIAIWLMLPLGQAKEVLGNQTSIKRETAFFRQMIGMNQIQPDGWIVGSSHLQINKQKEIKN